jgi:hypothetical protein
MPFFPNPRKLVPINEIKWIHSIWLFNLLTMSRTWWKLFQKRVLPTNIDIYVSLLYIRFYFLCFSAYGIYLIGGKAHPSTMDYDTKPQYQIIVACTDDLGLTTEKTFLLNVVRNKPSVINVLPSKYSVC